VGQQYPGAVGTNPGRDNKRMSTPDNSLLALLELSRQKAPEYYDLIGAKTDADFEKAFDAFLERVVSQLEMNKKDFETLDENALSAVVAMALSVPGLSATRETNSNGHVDITIVADHCMPMRKKLGEAKIYDGPEYHLKGLQQLLGRYTTGREGRGMLIVYFRKQNIAGLVKKLREKMDADLPCAQQGQTSNHLLKWSFLSKHAHSCGETLEVGHIGCNLYIEPNGTAAS
jgi:hypothetical protein